MKTDKILFYVLILIFAWLLVGNIWVLSQRTSVASYIIKDTLTNTPIVCIYDRHTDQTKIIMAEGGFLLLKGNCDLILGSSYTFVFYDNAWHVTSYCTSQEGGNR